MKVSIITLHKVTNFGSLLQTYATQKYIQNLGHETEVIDFVPSGLSFFRAIWPKGGNLVKKIIKLFPLLVCNLAQYSMVNKFLNKNIVLSKNKYKTFSELEQNVPDADVYLSGSDQVWNTQNDNTKDCLGAYCLAFTKSNNKISYAGSFGKKEFSEEEKNKVISWLSNYSNISVREDTAVETLREFGLEGIHVLDPTLLLTKEQWDEFCIKEKAETGYIFVYNLNRNKKIEEIAKRIAEAKGLRIVNFADTFEFIRGAENRLNNDPYDFIKYISNADYVVTDSFHGTAFSINFARQFICMAPPKYNCRLESILRMFDCENRMCNTVEQAMGLVDKKIDYEQLQIKLEHMRKISGDYLEEAFRNCE